ncbi:SulP family inorganic anion transporter [Desertibacillus haloalkaliphilus]|uniref:SulP family inorganic anion transporter n=1 Tax=Desertibacillus haloalkaliphilus TaxID=1328930 RepID=UPI001C261FFD|nr:SulP family inorganic anion transporter [Desertibacillus haloalkaliphilus]MBU8908227.1 sodium-independent anion transporter [Desertibacillus haloalkaliphilus]
MSLKESDPLIWNLNYRKSYLKGDITAGITVAIMLIPQGLAYAMLAGLPPIIGLYTATIPLLIYALLGSSRHLSVGPVSIVALLTFSGVSTLVPPGSEHFFSLVIILTFLVGTIQILLAIIGAGTLVKFIPHSVISGFTSAAAIIIGMNQLENLIQINMDNGGTALQLFLEFLRKLPEAHVITTAIGIGSIAILITLKKNFPKIPGPLFVVAGSMLIVSFFQLHHKGVSIIKDVPSGFPMITAPMLNVDVILSLLPTAITIALIGYVESITIAKYIANKENYTLDTNQELAGLGFANFIGSLFSSFPVAGAFSRTAVNYQSGGKTKFASIVTVIIMILTLLYLTQLFYYLPDAVLAAIIIVSIYNLIDVRKAVELFSANKTEGWSLVMTFIATLTFGVEKGLLIGVGFSLAVSLFSLKWLYVTR